MAHSIEQRLSEIEGLYERFQVYRGRIAPHPYPEVDFTVTESSHSAYTATAYGLPLCRHGVRLSGGGELRVGLRLPDPEARRYFLKINCALEQWQTRCNDLELHINGEPYACGQEFIETVSQGWPSLYYEVEAGRLREGENTVTLLTRDSSAAGLIVSAVDLVSLPKAAPYRQLSCLRAVRRGQSFTVAVSSQEPPSRVDPPGCYRYEGCTLLDGMALLRFTAAAQGQDWALALFSGAHDAVRLAMPQVVPASEDVCLVGMDSDDHRHDLSSESDRVLEVFALSAMGDFVQFRPYTGRTHLEFAPLDAWRRRAGLLRGMNVRIGIADTRSRLMGFMPELAGEAFVGCHIHEPYLYFSLTLENTRLRDEFMVNSAQVMASRSFGESERLYREVLMKTRLRSAGQAGLSSVGSPSLLCVYEAQAEFGRVTLEPVSNVNLLAAGGRGSAALWGAHVPVDWYFGSPNNACKSRKLRLALHYLYLAGAGYLYTENAVFKTNAFSREDWEDDFCSRNRGILRDFYEYVTRFPRPGPPVADMAVIYGRHEHFLWYHDNRMAESADMGDWDTRVWGKWEDERHRRCWRALDAWLPEAPRQSDPSPLPNPVLFSGTPYGGVDVIPWDGDYGKYRALALLGWNTMNEDMLARLEAFVRQGGALFLSACHLNATDRNDEPPELIRSPLLEELLGLRLSRETYPASGARFSDGCATGEGGDPVRALLCHPVTAETVAESGGRGLIYLNRYGEGQVYFGAFFDYFHPPWAVECAGHVLKLLGEQGPFYCDNPAVSYTVRELPEGWQVDVLNMNCAEENGREPFCLRVYGHTLTGVAVEGRIQSYRISKEETV